MSGRKAVLSSQSTFCCTCQYMHSFGVGNILLRSCVYHIYCLFIHIFLDPFFEMILIPNKLFWILQLCWIYVSSFLSKFDKLELFHVSKTLWGEVIWKHHYLKFIPCDTYVYICILRIYDPYVYIYRHTFIHTLLHYWASFQYLHPQVQILTFAEDNLLGGISFNCGSCVLKSLDL